MKKLYIFLDWSNTINEIIKNNKINKKKFIKFVKILTRFESKLNYNICFIIISGTFKNNAIKNFNIIKEAFKSLNKEKFLNGFAFEYGGYFIEGNGTITEYESETIPLNFQNKIFDIAKKYNYKNDERFNLYINFEFEEFNNNIKAFYEECQSKLKELDYEFYNDKFGCGIDVKLNSLNKGNFVKKYLDQKERTNDLIIVGGDSNQDLLMLNYIKNYNSYFIGFKKSNYSTVENLILSDKDNILGIVDCLKKIYNLLKNEH